MQALPVVYGGVLERPDGEQPEKPLLVRLRSEEGVAREEARHVPQDLRLQLVVLEVARPGRALVLAERVVDYQISRDWMRARVGEMGRDKPAVRVVLRSHEHERVGQPARIERQCSEPVAPCGRTHGRE